MPIGGDMFERRKHYRYAVRMDVEVEWSCNPAQRTSKSSVPISDVSLGGMFIITREPLPIGSQFAICLHLAQPLSMNCVVKHFVPGRGMGVEFLDVTDSAGIQLAKFLQTIADQAPAVSASPTDLYESESQADVPVTVGYDVL